MSSLHQIAVTVNGMMHHESVEPRLTAADFLRERLGLTGTRLGCEHGVCGACTILLDGEAVRSCLMFAVQLDGHRITTIEGVAEGGELHPLQMAFSKHHALQCGFCTPGFLLSALAFLADCPEPSEDDIRAAISGNLCRCTGYHPIIQAIYEVSRQPPGSGNETP